MRKTIYFYERRILIKTLGERLKFLRTQQKLTQAELGGVSGISKSNIGRIEKNEVDPSAKSVILLCAYFKVSTDWFLTGTEPNMHKVNETQFQQNEIQLDKMDRILIKKFYKLNPDSQLETLNYINEKLQSESIPDCKSSSSIKNLGNNEVG